VSEPTLEQLLGLDGDSPSDKPAASGGQLRAQLEAALAERKQALADLATYKARDRARTVADLVTKHNIPPLAQKLLLAEIGDGEPSDEAVTKFVGEFGELWGAKAAEASTTPDEQASTAQVQALSATGQATPLEPLDEEVYRARYAEAKSADEVMRMVAEAAGGFTHRES
jgi:hypothetical protein